VVTPKPSGQWKSATISELLKNDPVKAKRIIDEGCRGVAEKCLMQFMGTDKKTDARSSSMSSFSGFAA
jgi:hypothetical protein